MATHGKAKEPRHLALLDRKLVDVALGRIRRLLIFMPPRHGKSERTSAIFPAWFLGHFPDRRVLLASYEAEFAATWGRKARDLLERWGPSVFHVAVRSDTRAAHRWDVHGHAGGMSTAGVGGPLTGKGADLLIVDDPVKNAEEAASKVSRDHVWDWWQSTAYTRLEPDGVVVGIMTRWHEDDWAGRVLAEAAKEGERWEVIRLPAIAEDGAGDPIGRAPGEALWPERYDVPRLDAIKKAVGPYWWPSLYQQRPQPSGGGYFQRAWFRYYLEPEAGTFRLPDGELVRVDELRRFATVDLAASQRERADYTVVMVFGVTVRSKKLLLLEVVRAHMPATEKIPALWRLTRKWSLSFVGIESAGYQLSEVQRARAAGLPCVELHPGRADKVARALTAAAYMQGEQVLFPRSAPWLADLEAELEVFPVGTHDDQVDTLSYGAQAVTELIFGRASRCEWPDDYFPESIFFQAWPDLKEITIRVLALDPSKDARAKPEDFAALIYLARSKDGALWVQADMGHWPTQEVVRRTVEAAAARKADAVSIDAKVFGELFDVQLAEEAKRQGARVPMLPLEDASPADVRIRRLGNQLAAKRIRFHDDPETRLLVEQLRAFPSGDHDDGPDALELALRAAVQVFNARFAPASDGLGRRI